MSYEKILEELKEKCILKTRKKKMFTMDEIKAIHLMSDDPQFSVTRAAKYFHTDIRRLSRVVEILKTNDDYKTICDLINN